MLYQVSDNSDDAPVTMAMALMMATGAYGRQLQHLINVDRKIARETRLRTAKCCHKIFATKELKVRHQNDSFNFGHGRTE